MSADALSVTGVTVKLGDVEVLSDVTLALPGGAFMTIVGPNGSGKSTLLKVLLGLIKPDSGSAVVLGRPPGGVPPSQIGYVPQLKTLDRTFPALAVELVVTGLRGRWPGRLDPSEREAAIAAMEMTGVAHLADRSIGLLSGGELQRVYLARSMVRRPRLILLDEAAAGLDVAGEADMYHILEAYQRESGATVLMITHDWGAAYHHATHVLVLNRRVIGFGSPDEALSETSLREAFGHLGHAHAMKLWGNARA